jgi:hypothetical protein
MDAVLPAQVIAVDRLVPNPSNPNEMDDREFNALVASILEEGWTQPMASVVEIDGDDKGPLYEIVGGEHRWRAAQVIGLEDGPCWLLDKEKFDRDRRDWNLTKQNVLHGRLNPQKFAALYERMAKAYDAETLKTLMGFTTEDAFRKVYKEVKRGLPPELARALDDVKDEIRTIDDLSLVLNRLFREYGEDLPSNFMVFSWAGREVLWVRADTALWRLVSGLAAEARTTQGDLAERVKSLLDAGLATEERESQELAG